MTIINKIKELREKYPYKTALVDIKTGNKLTFSHMDIKSDRICTYFEKNGFKKGDKIVIFMPIGLEFYLTLMAIFKMGLVAVIMEADKEMECVDRYCGAVSAEGILADRITLFKGILLKNIRKIKKKINYKKMIESSETLPVIVKKKPKKYEKEEKEINENSPALIKFTDITDIGEKIFKTVMGTHGFLFGQYNVLERNMKFNKETKVYSLSPLFILSHMLTGVTTFISDVDLNNFEKTEYGDVVKQINENNIQNIILPVIIFENLAEYALKKNIIFKNVQTAYITGASVFPKIMKKIKKIFINAEIKVFYEISGVEPVSVLNFEDITKEDLEKMKDGKGLIIGEKVKEIEFEIKEIDEESDSKELKNTDRENKSTKNTWEQTGEIFVRGEHILKGNLNTDENKNRKWRKTGVSGYVDDKKRLILLGKIESKIDIEGKEYYPLAIETAFSFCKAVKKSALISKDDKFYLVLERNPEFTGNIEENPEIKELSKKFGIFKIIEEKIPVNKNCSGGADSKKLKELIDKI